MSDVGNPCRSPLRLIITGGDNTMRQNYVKSRDPKGSDELIVHLGQKCKVIYHDLKYGCISDIQGQGQRAIILYDDTAITTKDLAYAHRDIVSACGHVPIEVVKIKTPHS